MADTDAALASTDWEDLLQAWLHDPFDKALGIRGHEPRAARYASAALGREISRRGLHRLAADADRTAAMVERLPAPTAGAGGERAVGVADGLRLAHPMSGACVELKPGSVDPDRAVALLDEIVDGLPGPRERFLAVWRLLPDRIAAEFGEDAARLPADTRIPDHTLFQHVDVSAGLHAAGAPGGAACLSFALGPVQPFIEAARSVRDLWSGSALLSWLAFQAMKPILDRLGPTAFVYPTLRGVPLADFWLRRDAGLGERVPLPAPHAGRAPSLPNRFVAVAPWGRDGAAAAALRDACRDAARAGWRRLADAVRNRLDPAFAPLSQDWARFWEPQIESALDFRGAVVPLGALDDDGLARLVGAADFASGWPDTQKVRDLSRAMPAAHRPPYDQDHAGRWQAQMEMSARLMAATRAVRHVPRAGDAGRGPSPAKCTLFGSWEQMGPAESRASRTFWERAAERTSVDGVRLRPRERLCAVALTKRFAGPALLATELDLSPDDLRFPDTATVAAAEWLAGAGIDSDEERRRGGHWSGLWLHWRRQHEVDDERPVPEPLWKRLCEARKGRHGHRNSHAKSTKVRRLGKRRSFGVRCRRFVGKGGVASCRATFVFRAHQLEAEAIEQVQGGELAVVGQGNVRRVKAHTPPSGVKAAPETVDADLGPIVNGEGALGIGEASYRARRQPAGARQRRQEVRIGGAIAAPRLERLRHALGAIGFRIGDEAAHEARQGFGLGARRRGIARRGRCQALHFSVAGGMRHRCGDERIGLLQGRRRCAAVRQRKTAVGVALQRRPAFRLKVATFAMHPQHEALQAGGRVEGLVDGYARRLGTERRNGPPRRDGCRVGHTPQREPVRDVEAREGKVRAELRLGGAEGCAAPQRIAVRPHRGDLPGVLVERQAVEIHRTGGMPGAGRTSFA